MTKAKWLIAGNWKMNGSKATVESLLSDLAQGCKTFSSAPIEWLVCPSFVYLACAEKILKGSCIQWGAQDVSLHNNGAFTGQISAPMLKEFQCSYVIIGHSERRQLIKESDQEIALKVKKAFENSITPILCVGETLEQRENNETQIVIKKQLDAILNQLEKTNPQKMVIAYEPIWAIGTGKTASVDQARDVHEFIRNQLKKHDEKLASETRILYGGSVNAANAGELSRVENIDGFLVGGASLNAQQFLEIGKQCKL